MEIDKTYIENLSHTPENKLQPVNAHRFVRALDKTFGQSITEKAMSVLLTQDDNTFPGTQDFKERLTRALVDKGELSPTDQIYIADYVHRVFQAHKGMINP